MVNCTWEWGAALHSGYPQGNNFIFPSTSIFHSNVPVYWKEILGSLTVTGMKSQRKPWKAKFFSTNHVGKREEGGSEYWWCCGWQPPRTVATTVLHILFSVSAATRGEDSQMGRGVGWVVQGKTNVSCLHQSRQAWIHLEFSSWASVCLWQKHRWGMSNFFYYLLLCTGTAQMWLAETWREEHVTHQCWY